MMHCGHCQTQSVAASIKVLISQCYFLWLQWNRTLNFCYLQFFRCDPLQWNRVPHFSIVTSCSEIGPNISAISNFSVVTRCSEVEPRISITSYFSIVTCRDYHGKVHTKNSNETQMCSLSKRITNFHLIWRH